jgi:UDP-N-acetylmuramoyl-tripeptide--D-alanyl-D-alanine ligase
MITMKLSKAAEFLGVKYRGKDIVFKGCSTDSRTLTGGELFIALKGIHFDGHDFIDAAIEHGAVAAMVEKGYQRKLPMLVVDDAKQAMGNLARSWRTTFHNPLIAITGSNGKTTVKEMLVSILSRKGPVLATQANLNNDIGVPLTLFGLDYEHDYAVIEMGANHPGEIAWLSNIARPTVALITQCAPAHLEGFGSIDGVAHAKAEIYDGLDKSGCAIINIDDDYAAFWQSKINNIRQLGFGIKKPADISAQSIQLSTKTGQYSFILKTPSGSIDITLPIPGLHNVINSLAAAACAVALDFNIGIIKQGLEAIKPVKGRLEIKTGMNKSRIIDDTYNANPSSLNAALTVLKEFNGQHWLVLGDMNELGDNEKDLHEKAGIAARNSGVSKLFAIGTLSQFTVDKFGKGGEFFTSIEELTNRLQTEISNDVTVLVKGSRAMHMERVVYKLLRRNEC